MPIDIQNKMKSQPSYREWQAAEAKLTDLRTKLTEAETARDTLQAAWNAEIGERRLEGEIDQYLKDGKIPTSAEGSDSARRVELGELNRQCDFLSKAVRHQELTCRTLRADVSAETRQAIDPELKKLNRTYIAKAVDAAMASAAIDEVLREAGRYQFNWSKEIGWPGGGNASLNNTHGVIGGLLQRAESAKIIDNAERRGIQQDKKNITP